MNRVVTNLKLRLGGLVIGLLMIVAPRTTIRVLERQLRVLLAKQLFEAALNPEGS